MKVWGTYGAAPHLWGRIGLMGQPHTYGAESDLWGCAMDVGLCLIVRVVCHFVFHLWGSPTLMGWTHTYGAAPHLWGGFTLMGARLMGQA